MLYDIVIVGAGASGLMCSAYLSANNINKKVLIIDKNEKPGKKIIATGNGKCNLSNTLITSNDYISNNQDFIEYFPKLKENKEIIEFFNEIGVLTKNINNGIYPLTEQSFIVRDLLTYKIKENKNIDFLLSCTVNKIIKDDKYILETSKGIIKTNILIMATGGKSYPKFGSDGSGHTLITNLGLKSTKTYPALTALITKENLKDIKGVRAKTKVTLLINNKEISNEVGEVQFTEYGLSGICIFNLSNYITSNLKEKIIINLDLLPELSENDLLKELTKRKNRLSNKPIYYLLKGILNDKIIDYLESYLFLNNKLINELRENDFLSIIKSIKNLSFNIKDVKGYDFAQVTMGGISIKEINYDNFSSKKDNNLYILGELLDVTGKCGGFNLHFAFLSGYLAAKHIGENYDKN